MSKINRRSFLKSSAALAVPAFIPAGIVSASSLFPEGNTPLPVKFFGDGEMFEPADYLSTLQKVNTTSPIARDRYGSGGAVEALEKKFVEITGKESAVFMPSGTMANLLALSVLSGESTKVFVQETSHVYRDIGDAAQSAFSKRLLPLAKDEPYFTLEELQQAIDGLAEREALSSGAGAVSIENPVRRKDGRSVPLEEIKKISAYCRSKNMKLHLDGARIYIASAWSGVPIKEYASYFDTIYISLYKYLGASAGAILCGDKSVIGKMPHLIKVHGGSMYSNWPNAAMALHRLDGIDTRFQDTVKRAGELVTSLNKISGIKISSLPGGTNIYSLDLAKEIDAVKLQEKLNKDFNIRIPRANEKNHAMISMNETLLYQSAEFVIQAFSKSI